jgi:hypothetical protein
MDVAVDEPGGQDATGKVLDRHAPGQGRRQLAPGPSADNPVAVHQQQTILEMPQVRRIRGRVAQGPDQF